MKLMGKCECCGKEKDFEFNVLEFREYERCGCESKEGCHKWHDFIIDKKEIFKKFYPELLYKLKETKQ